jgi:hypothetical protein
MAEHLLTHSPGGTGSGVLDFPCGVHRLSNGNTLITDAGTEMGHCSELIEVDRDGEVVRALDAGFAFLHSVDVRSDGDIVLADTTNDRMVVLDRGGRVVVDSDEWSDGSGRLSDGSHLRYPNNVRCVDDGHTVVTDRNNDRALVVTDAGNVTRELAGDVKRPHNAEVLEDGRFIVADSDNNRVAIYNASGAVVWEYIEDLSWPRDADLLANGNVLITDSKHSRVIEVNPGGGIDWEYRASHFANFYEAHRLASGNTLISDQQHKSVIEVDPSGRVVWRFRNFKRESVINEKLVNGFFRKRDESGFPSGWYLARRFSEGGGAFFWGENERGKPVPGLSYDRKGGLSLQQTVRVRPGARYTVGGALRTVGLDGFACFVVAFLDELDGLLCEATQSPRGTSFSGTTDWTQDSFQVVVPEGAVAADLRVFVNGAGTVFADQLRFFQ